MAHDRGWAQGEQVVNTYGDQTNDSLLQFYGFIEPDNALDIYVLQDFIPRAEAAAATLALPLAAHPGKSQPDEEQFDAKLTRTGPDADVLQLMCSMLGLTLQPETHSPAYQVATDCLDVRQIHTEIAGVISHW